MPEFPIPVEQVGAAYRSWRETKGGSADLFLELMADDCHMRSVLSPKVGDDLALHRKSRNEAHDYFDAVARDWEMIDYPQDRIVADGDTVVWIGRCHWRHRATGREIDTPKVDIWRFANGKAVDFLEMFDSLGFVRTAGLG
jgi:ketosteroid isomerase-like protein